MQHGHLCPRRYRHGDPSPTRTLPNPRPRARLNPSRTSNSWTMLEFVLRENQIRIEEERFAPSTGRFCSLRRLQLAMARLRTDEPPSVSAPRHKTMSIQICAGLSVFVLRKPGPFGVT